MGRRKCTGWAGEFCGADAGECRHCEGGAGGEGEGGFRGGGGAQVWPEGWARAEAGCCWPDRGKCIKRNLGLEGPGIDEGSKMRLSLISVARQRSHSENYFPHGMLLSVGNSKTVQTKTGLSTAAEIVTRFPFARAWGGGGVAANQSCYPRTRTSLACIVIHDTICRRDHVTKARENPFRQRLAGKAKK